jgi:hypothetical protein
MAFVNPACRIRYRAHAELVNGRCRRQNALARSLPEHDSAPPEAVAAIGIANQRKTTGHLGPRVALRPETSRMSRPAVAAAGTTASR